MGAHLVTALLYRGHDVVALDDLSGGFTENVDTRARFVEASITDVDGVDRLFAEERFEHVFHLAAYAAEGLSHFIKRFNYTNNVIGSCNLINAAVNHGSDCFVFTSSIAVYGAAQTPMTEAIRNDPEWSRWQLERHPLKRFGKPEEVAAAIAVTADDRDALLELLGHRVELDRELRELRRAGPDVLGLDSLGEIALCE